jgi:RNA methyltransferase, TrmH family
VLHITSTSNPLIKDIAKLHTRAERSQKKLFIAEGIRTCETLIIGGYTCTYLLVTEAGLIDLNKSQAHTKNIFDPIEKILITSAILHKISTATTPCGIIGVFKQPQEPSLEFLTGGLVLAGISDPGNMGTLIRTCAALGALSLVIPHAPINQELKTLSHTHTQATTSVDPFSPKVIQSTAGTIAQVTIFQPSWPDLVAHVRNNNHSLCALVVRNGETPTDIIKKINPHHVLLVVGNEAHGIPTEWLNECDQRMTIPMPGGTESLNAAVAGSIALYLIKTNHMS